MSLAKKIARLRKRTDLSQRGLAAAAGLSSAYVSMLESGRKANLGGKAAVKLAMALGVSTDELLSEVNS
jgi:repressor LexA